MKLGGKTPVSHKRSLVLPRGDGEAPIVLWAQALPSLDEFTKLCPEPLPPVIVKPGGVKDFNWTDPNYLIAVKQYQTRRNDYILLESLKATKDLEWETVKYEDPDTWNNWRQELTDSGFSVFEVNRIFNLVLEANSLNDSLLDEAQKTFLAEVGDK